MNPLEQFIVEPLFQLHLFGMNFSFTNAALWMVLACLLSVLILWILIHPQRLVPGTGQSLAESLFLFIQHTAKETIGPNYKPYLPFLLSVFLFIFMGNFLGLFPYAFTFTSQFAPVGAFAILGLLLCMIVGIYKMGWRWFRTFMPEGIPLLLAPLIIPIELMSFIAKPFTLTVRLVMNMIVGHILLKLLAGFIFKAGLLGIFPLLFTGILIIFEIGISFLQAYIFTILTSIYLGEALHQE